MKPITKKLELSREEYYNMHLAIINAFLPVKLTTKEIEVLSVFMSIRGDLANSMFGTTAKKYVRDRLNLSHGGLGNYIVSLKEKGFLIGEKDQMKIYPVLHPDHTQQVYGFQLTNTDQ